MSETFFPTITHGEIQWYQVVAYNLCLLYYQGHPAICGLGISQENEGCKQNLHNGFSVQLVMIAWNSDILT